MKVIYALSDFNGWIDVVKNLELRKAWEPVCWITTPSNRAAVHQAFPGCATPDFFDGSRGRFDRAYLAGRPQPLDKKTIGAYLFYEKTALKMMDRMDPTGYSFNYSERTHLYYDILRYWLHTIKALSPDTVLFAESPHSPFTYLLYAVCVENNIKVLRLTPTHINGWVHLSGKLDESPKYLIDAYRTHIANAPSRLSKGTQNYIDRIRSDYSNAVPYYMKNIRSKRHLDILFYLLAVKKAVKFLLRPPTSYFKIMNRAITDPAVSGLRLIYYKIKGDLYKKRLERRYQRFCTAVDFTRPYIYVPLHYQPEKTTSPEGDVYVDQWLMLQLLSGSVPENWTIYVKEHVSQFSLRLYGEQGRTLDMYQKMAALEKVRLVDTGIPSFDLTDRAEAVATVTGTAGLEALIRRKPVLLFGNGWYRPCEGVFPIRNREDLVHSLETIMQGYSVDDAKVEAFLEAVDSVSVQGYINPSNRVGVNCTETENIKALTECIDRHADQIG